jgi:hypothetical protein
MEPLRRIFGRSRREKQEMNQTQSRISTQRAEDLHRLADQAEVRGIRILLTADGEHFATSSSNPTTLHRVSPQGCGCKGFTCWGRCMHHALLLSELGLIPDIDPIVTDVVILDEQPAPCRSCRGEGWIRMSTGAGLADWVAAECSCRASTRAVAPAA